MHRIGHVLTMYDSSKFHLKSVYIVIIHESFVRKCSLAIPYQFFKSQNPSLCCSLLRHNSLNINERLTYHIDMDANPLSKVSQMNSLMHSLQWKYLIHLIGYRWFHVHLIKCYMYRDVLYSTMYIYNVYKETNMSFKVREISQMPGIYTWEFKWPCFIVWHTFIAD